MLLRRLHTLVLFTVIVLPVAALAAVSIPDPGLDLGGFLTFLLAAMQGKQWGVVGAAIGIGLVWGLRTWGVKSKGWLGSFLATSRGGAVLALLTAIVAGIAAALVQHTPFSLDLAVAILGQGFLAIGGWVGLRRLLGIV